jgi:hypothetical protein
MLGDIVIPPQWLPMEVYAGVIHDHSHEMYKEATNTDRRRV